MRGLQENAYWVKRCFRATYLEKSPPWSFTTKRTREGSNFSSRENSKLPAGLQRLIDHTGLVAGQDIDKGLNIQKVNYSIAITIRFGLRAVA